MLIAQNADQLFPFCGSGIARLTLIGVNLEQQSRAIQVARIAGWSNHVSGEGRSLNQISHQPTICFQASSVPGQVAKDEKDYIALAVSTYVGSRRHLPRRAKRQLVFLLNAPIFLQETIQHIERLHIGPGQATARSGSPRWFLRCPSRDGLYSRLERLLLAPSLDRLELRACCCAVLTTGSHPAAVATILASAVPAGKLHNGVRTPWPLTLHPSRLLFCLFCSVQRSSGQQGSAHR